MRRGISASELAAAASATVPDVLAPGLTVVFCGINPGLWSAATGLHFARPGNRFWKALAGAGFTDGVLEPYRQHELLESGIGITNLVARATATAAELRPDELRRGAVDLGARLGPLRPAWVAVVGIQAYRVAFSRRRAVMGRQAERLAESGLWVLPNPSGAQARYQLPDLVASFGELRSAAGAVGAEVPPGARVRQGAEVQPGAQVEPGAGVTTGADPPGLRRRPSPA